MPTILLQEHNSSIRFVNKIPSEEMDDSDNHDTNYDDDYKAMKEIKRKKKSTKEDLKRKKKSKEGRKKKNKKAKEKMKEIKRE